MRKAKGDFFFFGWRRFLHLLLAAVFLCAISIAIELPKLLKSQLVPISSKSSSISSQIHLNADKVSIETLLRSQLSWKRSSERNSSSSREYGRIPKRINDSKNESRGVLSGLERMANEAWLDGLQLWQELYQNPSEKKPKSANGFLKKRNELRKEETEEECSHSIFLSKQEMKENEDKALFHCGLMLGSSITVVGTPLPGHIEKLAKVYRKSGRPSVTMVSQFIVELKGLKVLDNEDPPRILHVNPRLKGDWSGKSIFEVNTCYRGQWGIAQRCNGLETQFEDDTGDDF